MSNLMKFTHFLATLALVPPCVNAELAQNLLATKEEARALFNSAMTYLEVNGRSTAYRAFNVSNGKFTDRDLYVFCLGYDRTWKAMGANPSLVGQNASEKRDPNGKDYVGEFINIAKTSGVGTVSYIYKNPVTGTEQLKTSFIQKVANSEFCGMGYYE